MGACETPIAFAALVIEGYMEVSFVFKSKTLRDVPLSILIFNLIDSERKDLPNLAKVIKALVYLLCVFPKTSSEGWGLGLFTPLFARLSNFLVSSEIFRPLDELLIFSLASSEWVCPSLEPAVVSILYLGFSK